MSRQLPNALNHFALMRKPSAPFAALNYFFVPCRRVDEFHGWVKHE
jgi:hypothetical protein